MTTSNETWEEVYARRFNGLTKEEMTLCIKEQYKQWMGEYPDLENPKTFNEKLAWLKIHYENPLMTICADKVKARDYFCEKITNGEKYLVEQYGVYASPDEIDYNTLPNSFILKSNWGSSKQIIVTDKSTFNIENAKKVMNEWLKHNSNNYYFSFENSYKGIEPRIVCEKIIDFDYKLEFFCFNGEPRYFWIIQNDKTSKVRANFYELDWTKMPLMQHYHNFDETLEKPSFYQEMVNTAKILSKGFPHVRCDFYKQKDGFKFSEMTFYTWAGLYRFEPDEYDLKFGNMLTLPKTNI